MAFRRRPCSTTSARRGRWAGAQESADRGHRHEPVAALAWSSCLRGWLRLAYPVVPGDTGRPASPRLITAKTLHDDEGARVDQTYESRRRGSTRCPPAAEDSFVADLRWVLEPFAVGVTFELRQLCHLGVRPTKKRQEFTEARVGKGRNLKMKCRPQTPHSVNARNSRDPFPEGAFVALRIEGPSGVRVRVGMLKW